MGRIYVDKYTGTLKRTDLYHVSLTLRDGTVIEPLEPRLLFPFSNTTMFITLLDKDEKEIGFVRDLEELNEDSAKALQACFSEYYMIPKIDQIIAISEKYSSIKWTVKTDRGTVSFRIRNRQSDIKNLYGTTRVLIRDSNDNRYEIPDYTKLDQHSKYLLFPYL